MDLQEVVTKSQNELELLTLAHQRHNEVCVPMGRGSFTVAMPGTVGERIISIASLGSYTATALLVQYNNGKRYAAVTHYAPMAEEVLNHGKRLKELCLKSIENEEDASRVNSINFFITAPGEYKKNHQSGVWELKREINSDDFYLKFVCLAALDKIKPVEMVEIPYDSGLISMFDDNKGNDFEVVLVEDGTFIISRDGYKIINLPNEKESK